MIETQEKPPGIISVDNHYREDNVHLISNYWGLESFMDQTLPDHQLNLLFVSTASRPYPEHGEGTRFLDAERSWLEEKQNEGKIKYREFCIHGRQPDEVREAVDGIDVLFMGGGNTQYLLEQIQDSGAGPIIKESVEGGVIYFGKSAGAIVAGPDIEPRGFLLNSMATRPLTDTRGLGLTNVYPLPHIDTPKIMDAVYNGKTGWQHAVELAREYHTAYILDNLHKK